MNRSGPAHRLNSHSSTARFVAASVWRDKTARATPAEPCNSLASAAVVIRAPAGAGGRPVAGWLAAAHGWLAGTTGVGFIENVARTVSDYELIWVTILIMGSLGLMFDLMMRWVIGRLIPWRGKG